MLTLLVDKNVIEDYKRTSMYKIEKQPWGFKLTLAGSIASDEMARWLDESRKLLVEQQGEFFVFVDMRDLIPLDPKAQVYIQDGQRIYRNRGMVRSVVILSSPVVAAQFRRIGGETGIGKWERYIDASTNPNWEEVGMKWLLKSIDPNKIQQKVSVK